MLPEVKRRFGQANSRYTEMVKPVFARKALAIEKKVNLFRSLVLSSLWYNTAIWPRLTPTEQNKFDTMLFRLYRRLMITHTGEAAQQWSRDQVYASVKLPIATVSLQVERLRHLKQLVHHGEPAVWALLQNERKWLQMVCADLEWLKAQGQGAYPASPPEENWSDWMHFIEQKRNSWNALLKRSLTHSVLHHVKNHQWETWHADIVKTLEQTFLAPPVSREATVPLNGEHACLQCSRIFASKSAWAVHAFKAHQRLTPARRIADGTSCDICQRQFHEHIRLIRHLTHATSCRAALLCRAGPVAPQAGMNSKAEAQERHQRHVRPVMQMQGPLGLSPARLASERFPAELTGPEIQLAEALMEATDQPWQDVDGLLDHMRKAVRNTTLHPDEIRSFAKAWASEVVLRTCARATNVFRTPRIAWLPVFLWIGYVLKKHGTKLVSGKSPLNPLQKACNGSKPLPHRGDQSHVERSDPKLSCCCTCSRDGEGQATSNNMQRKGGYTKSYRPTPFQ